MVKSGVFVKYRANNSGGSWWLEDEDWKALSKAGWNVEWGGVYFCHSKYSSNKVPPGKSEPCPELKGDDCPGHRKYDSPTAASEDRYMGALAVEAKKMFKTGTIKEALEEFEKITGQTVTDEGCNCCGPPHSFEWGESEKAVEEDHKYEYGSGENLLRHMYPGKRIPKNLREAMDEG